jgi:Ring finger domain
MSDSEHEHEHEMDQQEVLRIISELVMPFNGGTGLVLRQVYSNFVPENEVANASSSNVVERRDDDDSFIPCEICNQMIRFDEYSTHIDRCSMPAPLPTPMHAPTLFIPMDVIRSTSHFNVLPQLMRNIIMGNTNDYESNLLIQEMMGGSISKGIENKDQVTTTVPFNDVPGDVICTICQDSFGPEKTIKKTSCNHYFCQECLYTWLNDHNTCPNCFKQLEQ